ncbi:hypothetical protein L5515_016619 [Caenorhabditis briggsae]|uniref:LITAF domain-containing protein n=1 Tax=Caenorhabditis briggsae TaxID=6238 RepID=A0AAE9FDE3_CAEBR|nr:hypothetical protein L3Y34_010734 [Caenorhabditis briggsae]UMM39674.1 hypothetical protein L5515_016619 [Caenorhabditis briggsae]
MSFPNPPAYDQVVPPAYNPDYAPTQPVYHTNNHTTAPPYNFHDNGGFENVADVHSPVYTTIASGPMPCSTIIIRLEPHATKLQCPYCRTDVVTRTKSVYGLLTWIFFAALFLFGCWCCCFVPFCLRSCKDIIHTCPNCRAMIGIHRRI